MIAFARNILTDLVEKRLWPVAVALIAALVAVPVLLGSGGEAPTSSPAPVAPSTGTASRAEVTLDTAAPAARDRDGRLRDPFATSASAGESTASASTASTSSASTASGATTVAATPVPAPTASATTLTGGGGDATASTTRTTSAPSSTAPVTTAPGSAGGSDSATTTTTPAAGTSDRKTSATYEVSVRFGPTAGERETLRNVARLTALPNAKEPVVTLLGVLAKARKAVFMVSATTTASGNGDCKPSVQDCKTVELREGDAEYLRVVSTGRPDVWYYLKLLHIDRHRASAAQAAAASVRHSRAGTAVVRGAGASVRPYRYLPGAGVLVRAKRATAAGVAASASTRIAPLLPADEQPGVVAWRSVKPAAKR